MDDKDIYINSKFKEYKNSEDKKAFLAELLMEAYKEPDVSWSIWAPTKKVAYEFELVEVRLYAEKFLKLVQEEKGTMEAAVDMCLTTCKSEKNDQLDTNKLKKWEKTFESYPNFPQLVEARKNELNDMVAQKIKQRM